MTDAIATVFHRRFLHDALPTRPGWWGDARLPGLALLFSLALHAGMVMVSSRQRSPLAAHAMTEMPPLRITIVPQPARIDAPHQAPAQERAPRSAAEPVPRRAVERPIAPRLSVATSPSSPPQNPRDESAPTIPDQKESTTAPQQPTSGAPSSAVGHPSLETLMQSAGRVARDMARQREQKPWASSTSAPGDTPAALPALSRSLERQQQAPGEYRRPDGSTRIVTKNGTAYCVKPIADGGTGGDQRARFVTTFCD